MFKYQAQSRQDKDRRMKKHFKGYYYKSMGKIKSDSNIKKTAKTAWYSTVTYARRATFGLKGNYREQLPELRHEKDRSANRSYAVGGKT